MTRRFGPFAVLALTLLLAVGSPVTAAKRTQRCQTPASARVLAKSRDAVVYRRPADADFWHLIGCWRPTGARTILIQGSDDILLGRVTVVELRLAGPYLAYVHRYETHYGDVYKAAWRADLRRPAQPTALGRGVGRSGCCLFPQADEGLIDSLRLDGRGRVAWRQQDEHGWQVWSYDRRGSNLLDLGDEPVLDLRLANGILSWTRAGHFLHARLVR